MNAFGKFLAGALLAGAAVTPLFAQASDSESTTSTVRIIQPISLTLVNNLAFGTVVRPTTGTYTVTMGVGSDTPSGTGGTGGALLATGTRTRASYTATGEGGQTIAITVPASVTMSSGGNNISVTLTGEAATDTLTGTIGSTGNFSGDGTFYVGGAFDVTSATVSGNYTGSFSTTIAYN